MIATFLRKKEEILNTALQYKEVFEALGLTLDLAYSLFEAEKETLVQKCQNTQGDRFQRSIGGLVKSGELILRMFLEEKSFKRADQLITWLTNSGGIVVLYSKLGV